MSPERRTRGTVSEARWSYLRFRAKKILGEVDAYVRVRSMAAEDVSPPRPADWSERLPPRQEVLLVSVETKIDPTFGSAVRLEDRSWLVADGLFGNAVRFGDEREGGGQGVRGGTPGIGTGTRRSPSPRSVPAAAERGVQRGPKPLLALWQVRNQWGRGDDEYEKTYWFTRDGVHRMRKTPASLQEAGRPPEQWSDQKKSVYGYPEGRWECTGVGTPVALLFMASRSTRPDSASPRHLCVFDRKELYDVLIKQGATRPPDFDVVGVPGYPPGRPETKEIVFEPRSLRGTDGKEFSFLGISGDFRVVFDLNSGIPLKLKGSVPGVGETELVLQEVRLSTAQPTLPRESVH